MRPRKVAPGLCLLAAASLLGGCATAVSHEDAFHPAWPPEPAEPRVVHRMNVRGPRDLGKPGLFGQIGELIAGEQAPVLLRPTGIAVSDEGRLYIADQERQGVHLLALGSPASRFLTRAGDDFFVSPVDAALTDDRLAVSDSGLNAVALFDRKGEYLGRLEKPGGWRRPTGMAYDRRAQELYVVDTLANEVCVFDAGGELVRRFGRHGRGAGEFNYPTHVFVDDRQRVFVTDSLNFRVQVLDREGDYLFEIGELGDATGYMAVPKGVAVDRFGHIYVVDSYFSSVQVFDEAGQLLLAIGGPGERSGEFQVPTGLAIDSNHRIYVCDSYNKRIQVLEYVGGPRHEP